MKSFIKEDVVELRVVVGDAPGHRLWINVLQSIRPDSGGSGWPSISFDALGLSESIASYRCLEVRIAPQRIVKAFDCFMQGLRRVVGEKILEMPERYAAVVKL